MNLARFESEVHMVERNDARIALGEAARFDNWFLKIGHDRRNEGTSAQGPTSTRDERPQLTLNTALKSFGGKMLSCGTVFRFDLSTTKIFGPTCLTRSLPSRRRVA